MNNIKKIIYNFIIDKLSTIVLFWLNTIFILLFFYLSTEKESEIIYPLQITLFLFIIFISYEFYKYYSFNKKIKKTIENPNYHINTKSHEQKIMLEIIKKIHQKYINEINDIKYQQKQKNKFISQWIHNMKTPVTVIDLIAQKQIENEEYKPDTIQSIKDENDRILDHLHSILNMMRIEDFSKDYKPEPVDIHQLLKEVINERKNQFIYNKVYPKVECENKENLILTDKKWNKFMIEQIISNAIQYSKYNDGNKYVFFNIIKQEKYTILSIKDEGIGIPDYDINRVFEPFFTGENGRIIKNSTGIGLYICKIIVDKLGHDISIESEVNKGTIVKITYLTKL